MKEFYVISADPEGRTDPESGPDGPYTLEEAVKRLWPPDPLSGWRTVLVKVYNLEGD